MLTCQSITSRLAEKTCDALAAWPLPTILFWQSVHWAVGEEQKDKTYSSIRWSRDDHLICDAITILQFFLHSLLCSQILAELSLSGRQTYDGHPPVPYRNEFQCHFYHLSSMKNGTCSRSNYAQEQPKGGPSSCTAAAALIKSVTQKIC